MPEPGERRRLLRIGAGERRAQAVERWLQGNGATGPRYASRGLGGSRPVAPNARPNGADDPDGRQRNRRVEVVLQRA